MILTGPVPDDKLAAIYSGAHALVMPSDDEGFGLPTVEALACNTPVVTCEVSALQEVLGARATFVERGDMEGAPRGRAPSRSDPRRSRRQWTWADAARATWQAYDEAINEASAGRTTAVGLCRAPVGARL